mmetsp:Transcript_75796/g.214296  ORF Transcript_75796/g.214296 Transcript_75796/m.214296 type:complete len:236 (-) Transcript_75796:145-852(-)
MRLVEGWRRARRRHQRGGLRVHQARGPGRHRPQRGRRLHGLRLPALLRPRVGPRRLAAAEGLPAVALRLAADGPRRGVRRHPPVRQVHVPPLRLRAQVAAPEAAAAPEHLHVLGPAQDRRDLPGNGPGRVGRLRDPLDHLLAAEARALLRARPRELRHGLLLPRAPPQHPRQLVRRELHGDGHLLPRVVGVWPAHTIGRLRCRGARRAELRQGALRQGLAGRFFPNILTARSDLP